LSTKSKHTFYYQYLFFENRAFYEKKWKQFCRAGHTTAENMAHVHRMLDIKATNTHSENVIFFAFELRQRLHERASILRLYVFYPPCFFMAQQPLVGQGLLIVEVSRSHSVKTHHNRWESPGRVFSPTQKLLLL
jgi:hypothetical protein